MTMLGTREINNVEVEVHASIHGSWTIYKVGEGTGHERHLATDEKSLENAVNKARMEIKKQQVKVAVPFKMLDGGIGVASGRHARSHSKILAKINGKSEQIEWSTRTLKHDTPQSVIDHLHELREEQVKLQREERELYNEWKFDLSTGVDAAIKEAVKAQS